MGVAYKPIWYAPYCHIRLLELEVVSKAMPTSKVSLWREFLLDLAAWPGMLSIDALAVRV